MLLWSRNDSDLLTFSMTRLEHGHELNLATNINSDLGGIGSKLTLRRIVCEWAYFGPVAKISKIKASSDVISSRLSQSTKWPRWVTIHNTMVVHVRLHWCSSPRGIIGGLGGRGAVYIQNWNILKENNALSLFLNGHIRGDTAIWIYGILPVDLTCPWSWAWSLS